jgi:hypothetical protein
MSDWTKLTPASWADFEARQFAEALAEAEDQVADLNPADREKVLDALREQFERQHDENMGAVAKALKLAH